MGLSRIGSRSTYVQCLKALDVFGYIVYQQSKQAYTSSLVGINPLKNPMSERTRPENEPQEDDKNGPRIEPEIDPCTRPDFESRCGPELSPFNKHINNNKQKRESKPPHSESINKYRIEKAEGTPRAEMDKDISRDLPALCEVEAFFSVGGYPRLEADKFFHHYQANGWRQGSGAKITDWQSAARKWFLNIHSLKIVTHDKQVKHPTGAGRLHSKENKNYSEPL